MLGLSVGRKPRLRVLVRRLLLAVVALVRLLLTLLVLVDLAGLVVGIQRRGRLGVLVFRSRSRGSRLRLLQVLVLLVVLLREHALLLAGKLALSVSANLAGLIESSLALSIDVLNGEGVLLLGLRLGLGDLGRSGLSGLLGRRLRDSRLLRSGGLLSLNGRLSSGCNRLSGFCGRGSLVFIQGLGRLTREISPSPLC